MKPYAIYIRVSDKRLTHENQRLTLTAYAKAKGWDYEVFEEVESTRKTRPIKEALLQRLRKKEFAGVIVYKIDRWARSTAELILEVADLYERGIYFIATSQNVDLSSSSGKLQFTILAAFAEFEREIIRERTLEGLARAKSQGKSLGRPKGSKDARPRRKSGYLLRYAKNADKHKWSKNEDK